jgi:hypothetical protein
VTGIWDCANRRCQRYHELTEHEYREHHRAPKCGNCRHPLRLVSVKREMTGNDKARLAALTARRKERV